MPKNVIVVMLALTGIAALASTVTLTLVIGIYFYEAEQPIILPSLALPEFNVGVSQQELELVLWPVLVLGTVHAWLGGGWFATIVLSLALPGLLFVGAIIRDTLEHGPIKQR